MHKFHIIHAVFSALFIFSNILFAQNKLSGTISDKNTGEPLTGVSIYNQKLMIGAVSGVNGTYEMILPQGKHVLSFSYLGYKTANESVYMDKKNITLDVLLSETTTELGEVVVTSKSEARQIREQAMPIAVITMNELQGTVSDVSEVLSKTSGVKIRSSGGVGSSTRISVRGLEGKRIGFFIDETPLSDNTDFIDVNDIPIDLIDRIEVYKGIVPAKFGGSAVGGAVNIVIKEYPPKYLDAGYSIQSFNTHKASAVFKRNKKGIEAGVGGFYTYSDNNYKMELPKRQGTDITRNHDQFKKLVIAGGFTSKIWWFDEVNFEPILILTEKEIQGIEEYDIRYAKSYADAYVLSNHIEKTDFLIEGLDVDISNAYGYTIYRFQDTARIRYGWDGEAYLAVTDYGLGLGEIGTQPNDVYNKKHTFLQKTNLNYIINPCNSLNFNSQFNLARGIPSDTIKDKVVGYKSSFNSLMNSLVTGISYEFNSLNRKFTNAFTVKYYFYSMTTKLVDLYGYSSVPENINMKKNDYGISNALRFRITSDFLIKASLAYDVRLPSENELLGDGFIVAPAANLEPERNTSFNLGFMYDVSNKKLNRFQFEINGFYMQLDNMIRFTGGPLQSIYQNFGEMRTLGIESEIKWDATQFLYLWGNITYQDLRDTREFEPASTVSNPTKGDRMPNIPYLFANAGLELHKANLFGGNGQNTRWFTDCSFIEEYFYDFEQSIYQERKIPRTLTFDTGLEHSLKNQSVFISIKVNNLTDAKVLSEFNRPLPGRNFGLKIRYIWK